METMQRTRFKITGISPILQHSPASMKRGGEGPARKKIPSPEEEAAAGVYCLPTGQIYAPGDWFRSSLLDGGVGLRLGKAFLKSLLQSSVFLVYDEEPLHPITREPICLLIEPSTGEPITEYEIDVRRVVVQGNGVQRARPRLERWGTWITLEYDPDILTPAHILEAFQIAGKRVGVGEYRPKPPKGKGGPFGRYIVELVGGANA